MASHCFPLTFFAFRGLADRGWIVAKTLGLVFTAWLVWVVVSLGISTYTNLAIWTIIAGTGLAGATLAWIQRAALSEFVATQWREVAWCELVFLLGFIAFALLRMWYPDLGHQFSPVSPSNPGDGRMGEKQLELAFLNAITRSRTFPPLDPFFAGGYINYYYFGYLLVATLARATTIAPALAFNLAIATFFGLLLGTSYSVGRALTRSITFGLVTAAFVCCIGNLNGLVQAVNDLQAVATTHLGVPFLGGIVELVSGVAQALFAGRPPPSFDFWESSRLVPPVGIDFAEFPFFTYLFGDLHAHLMAFPMTLGVVALAYSLAVSFEPSERLRTSVRLLLAGLLLGAIEATNSLDFPTYAVVLGLGAVVGLMERRRRLTARAGDGATCPAESGKGSWLHPVDMVAGAVVAILASVLAVILFPPFTQGYHPVFSTGLSSVQSQIGQIRAAVIAQTPSLTASQVAQQAHDIVVTPLATYWEIFGLFLFISLTWLAIVITTSSKHIEAVTPEPQDTPARIESRWSLRSLAYMSVAALAAITFIVMNLLLLAFLIVFAGLVLWVIATRRRSLETPELFALGILLLPILLTAFTEVLYVPDYLSGGLAFRMNTVAKLYNQIWVLYAIGATAALSFLWKRFSTNAAHMMARSHQNGDSSVGAHYSVEPNRRYRLLRTVRHHPLWVGILAVLVSGSLIYTFAGTVARETYRQTWLPENSVPFTLDGMAFMKVAYPNDYAGINWLNAHVRGTPVIVEADQAFYNWRSRVVQFTGLPTLLGGIYEPAQRYATEVGPRQTALEEIYSATPSTTSPSVLEQFGAVGCRPYTEQGARCLTAHLLHRYDVSYVYSGLMEAQIWSHSALKFTAMSELRTVFHRGDVTIYHVKGSPT